jgi:hypothetical protein
LASAFEPSCPIVTAPSWWAIIMVRNCLSKAAPAAASSFVMSAADMAPGIAPCPIQGMAMPGLGAGRSDRRPG